MHLESNQLENSKHLRKAQSSPRAVPRPSWGPVGTAEQTASPAEEAEGQHASQAAVEVASGALTQQVSNVPSASFHREKAVRQ